MDKSSSERHPDTSTRSGAQNHCCNKAPSKIQSLRSKQSLLSHVTIMTASSRGPVRRLPSLSIMQILSPKTTQKSGPSHKHCAREHDGQPRFLERASRLLQIRVSGQAPISTHVPLLTDDIFYSRTYRRLSDRDLKTVPSRSY
jgi:hypothetical protein